MVVQCRGHVLLRHMDAQLACEDALRVALQVLAEPVVLHEQLTEHIATHEPHEPQLVK